MINSLKTNIPIVNDNGIMEKRFIFWAQNVSRLGVIVGTGSPEGVVEAIQTQTYMDDAGTAGSISYIKRDDDVGGDKSLGWILV